MCRVQDVAELLGMMVKDYKRVQPNVKTHAYVFFLIIKLILFGFLINSKYLHCDSCLGC